MDLLPLFPEHSTVTPSGELAIGGVGVTELAERFGTPAYLVDESGLRRQARRLRDGLAARRPDSDVVFASKSFPCLAVYKLFAAEGLGIDVAGDGELVMALAAGVAPERIYVLQPGDSHFYDVGMVHSPKRDGLTKLVRIEGANLDHVKRSNIKAA